MTQEIQEITNVSSCCGQLKVNKLTGLPSFMLGLYFLKKKKKDHPGTSHYFIFLFQNISNDQVKAKLDNVEELTEHKIDKILQRFFKGFRGG